VILEYCGGGNLHKALQKDGRSAQRRLVCPLVQLVHINVWRVYAR
jgi:hypothetical protein